MDYHRPSPLDVESGREMANDHAPTARRRLKISIALAALAALALYIVFSGYGGTSGSAVHSNDQTVGQSISLAEALCSNISGSYIRSSDQALIKIEQTGCAAQFTRVNGTVGRPASSATVRGTRVMPYQSAPGRVQENADIRFRSGVVYAKIKDGYAKIKCSDISGSYIPSGDRALFTVKQKGCAAHFKRVNGTVGSRAYSATVSGTKVTRHHSAPGDVQENGDIRFLSGVVYAKIAQENGDIRFASEVD